MSKAMMAMTTSSSIKVKPFCLATARSHPVIVRFAVSEKTIQLRGSEINEHARGDASGLLAWRDLNRRTYFHSQESRRAPGNEPYLRGKRRGEGSLTLWSVSRPGSDGAVDGGGGLSPINGREP